MSRGASLRRRLLALIVIPLIVLAALAALARYRLAEDTSRAIYDKALMTVALAVSRDVLLTEGDLLTEELLETLTEALGDQVFYHVTGPDQIFVTGYSDPPPPPAPLDLAQGPIFYDGAYRGDPVRAVALREYASDPDMAGWMTVTVWQTVRRREALSLQLALRSAALMLLIVAAAGAIVWFGVRLGLSPLTRLRDAVARRSADDPSPIAQPTPPEAAPLVGAMNRLFGAVEDAFAARDAFISDAAHQLRNPIAALQAQAEAARTAPDEAELRRRVGELSAAARRAGRLTRQLLSMEKARARPDAVTARTVDLVALAEETCRGFAERALPAGVDVAFDAPDAPLLVRGDPVMLAEALENLLDNAQRYGCARGEGGAVSVVLRRAAGDAELSVEDDGPGVAPALRDRIFERFARADDAEAGGCGLGLAIVREIARRHGGDARLASPPETGGRGARFIVTTPLADL